MVCDPGSLGGLPVQALRRYVSGAGSAESSTSQPDAWPATGWNARGRYPPCQRQWSAECADG